MSLIGSADFNNKVIKRIKIKTRAITNPEQSSLKTASNNKKTVQHLTTERKQNIFVATAFSQNNHNESCNQNARDNYDKTQSNFLQLQTPFKDKNTSNFEKDLKIKKKLDFQAASSRKQIKNSAKLTNQLSLRFNSPQNKIERNRIVHMGYKQYQSIINQQELSPTYFQNIAKRNDQIMVKKDFTQKDLSSIETKETNKTASSILPKVQKRKRVKTTVQSTQKNDSMKTIIGCHLGALSNIQIRQKLQEKWIKEQRQIIKNNRTMVFTEQSEIVSQVDTRQPTQRQHFSIKNRLGKKNKKEKIVKEKDQINWDNIPNDKFKQALKRILQVKPVKQKEGQHYREFSYGEEYSERQQVLLLARQKLYKAKQLVLKHKLQWKK